MGIGRPVARRLMNPGDSHAGQDIRRSWGVWPGHFRRLFIVVSARNCCANENLVRRAGNARMRKREKHGISEAKKAPFKVALGTKPFWLRRCRIISHGHTAFFCDAATPSHVAATLTRQRSIQLISGADTRMGLPAMNEGAGAARLNR